MRSPRAATARRSRPAQAHSRNVLLERFDIDQPNE
jgi:hypothetical protein